jgi:hypothetical protein
MQQEKKKDKEKIIFLLENFSCEIALHVNIAYKIPHPPSLSILISLIFMQTLYKKFMIYSFKSFIFGLHRRFLRSTLCTCSTLRQKSRKTSLKNTLCTHKQLFCYLGFSVVANLLLQPSAQIWRKV